MEGHGGFPGLLFYLGTISWGAHKASEMDTELSHRRFSPENASDLIFHRRNWKFLPCKAMGIVSKSNLSVSEHGSMHDYIHVTRMLLGNARSCNSRFISGSIARSNVCMAAMCIMATGAMKSGVQLDDDESRIINRTTAKALRVSGQEVSQMPDNVGIWMQTYNKDSNRIGIWIKSRLNICN